MDADVGATIYYRWIFDYPPYQQGVTGTGVQGMITTGTASSTVPLTFPGQLVDCPSSFNTMMPEHRLEVVVANQPFSTTSTVLDLPDDPTAIVDSRAWTLQTACPAATISGSQ